jgi:hypothetical protein
VTETAATTTKACSWGREKRKDARGKRINTTDRFQQSTGTP